MHYNLLQLGNNCGSVSASDKFQWLGTILNHHRPHLLTVNELNPNQSYSNGIRQLSFYYTDDVEYAEITNLAGSNIGNQLFYDTNVFGYAGVEVIANSLRDINVYKMYVQPSITFPGF